MQGLADGYFVLPYTIQNYLADQITVPRFSTDLPEFAAAEKAVQEKIDWMMNIKGKKSVDSIHKELGHIMWEYVGLSLIHILLLVAVKPEYQNKGVNALLFSDLIPVYQQLGFEYAESNRCV